MLDDQAGYQGEWLKPCQQPDISLSELMPKAKQALEDTNEAENELLTIDRPRSIYCDQYDAIESH